MSHSSLACGLAGLACVSWVFFTAVSRYIGDGPQERAAARRSESSAQVGLLPCCTVLFINYIRTFE